MKYPKMLRNLILVKTPKETKTEGGIELPTSAIEERKMAGAEGIAVVVGKDCEEVHKGDKVLPKAFIGQTLDDFRPKDNYWYTVISEEDILCIWPTN